MLNNSDLAGKIAMVDLPAVVEAAGVTLSKKGARYWGNCPFHDDETPSFSVCWHGPKRRFRCWGCGASGDAVDFVKKAYSLDFNSALAFLEISPDRVTPGVAETIRRNRRGADLVSSFKEWVGRQIDMACFVIHTCNRHVKKIKDPEDMDTYGMFYHRLAVAEYHHSWLCDADDEALFSLFRDGGFYG